MQDRPWYLHLVIDWIVFFDSSKNSLIIAPYLAVFILIPNILIISKQPKNVSRLGKQAQKYT